MGSPRFAAIGAGDEWLCIPSFGRKCGHFRNSYAFVPMKSPLRDTEIFGSISVEAPRNSMTDEALKDLATRIRNHLGCSKDLAVEYARGVGDPPEIQNGQVLVRNAENRIVARIPASVLE